MTYKYGTTILVKPETKDRILAWGKHGDSLDTIMTRILDRVEEYNEISSSKENRLILNRMVRELPKNQQKEFDEKTKDEKGNTKIPIEVGMEISGEKGHRIIE